mgnify:CR=1 FL=1
MRRTVDDRVLSKIASVDWDFKEASHAEYTHPFHAYPARFIPEIPRMLIRILSTEDDLNTLDPFCGCGTTLVESLLEGKNAFGIDANPLAVLISKVKTKPLHRDLQTSIDKFFANIETKYNFQYQPEIPRIPNLNHWFPAHTQRELTIIREEIDSLSNRDVRDFYRVALSSILLSVSYQESDTRYARVERRIKRGDAIRKLRAQLLFMNRQMAEYSSQLVGKNIKVEVFCDDVRSFDPQRLGENSMDLAVFSPPYPNAYEYYLYHKYRMYWLGFDPHELRQKEIGVRADYSKDNNLTEQDFYNDMAKCFKMLGVVLKTEKYMACVIGDSIIKGKKIDNSSLIERAGRTCGFELIGKWSRNINQRRKSFNPRIGSKRNETILILKNRKAS